MKIVFSVEKGKFLLTWHTLDDLLQVLTLCNQCFNQPLSLGGQ